MWRCWYPFISQTYEISLFFYDKLFRFSFSYWFNCFCLFFWWNFFIFTFILCYPWPHVQSYTFHSSQLLLVDLYFKGSIKLQVIVIYIPPRNNPILRSSIISQLLSLLDSFLLNSFYHVVLSDFNIHIDNFYSLYLNDLYITW